MAFRVSLVSVLLASSGCDLVRGPEGPAGAQGEVGPAGPAGEQGAPGENGRDGADGMNGEDGDAGILYSDWFDPKSWTSADRFGVTVFSHEVSVPELDADIIDTGVVLVYGKLEFYLESFWPSGQVGQLPIDVDYEATGIRYVDSWDYRAEVGTLTLEFSNNENLYTFLEAGNSFRYVLIPGGTQLAQEELDELVDLPYDDAMDRLAEIEGAMD